MAVLFKSAGGLNNLILHKIRHFYADCLFSTSTNLTSSTKRPPPWRGAMGKLFYQIRPIGDPRISIIPYLDRWTQKGKPISGSEIKRFIRELCRHRRYSHALEISVWMIDKRNIEPRACDVVTRLDLIFKVHGIEQVEAYFNSIPQELRVLETYSALLNCYVDKMSVGKAEDLVQKMRDLGFSRTTWIYNIMLKLYRRTGNTEKFDTLLHEMGEYGISYDKFTYGIKLSACADVSDVEGMKKIITIMESDPKIVFDWSVYYVVASEYIKTGFFDEAFEMLKKSEGLITSRERSSAYQFLIPKYAAIGKKDQVLRVWELYKELKKISFKGYVCVITSLLKFGDLESVEKVFEEWEYLYPKYDIRIPNFLIGAYCRKGLLEKAEILVNRVMLNGGQPDAHTWYYLAVGYLENDETSKAVEMMKKMLAFSDAGWRTTNESLIACLEYLRRERNVEKPEEFLKFLKYRNIISVNA